MLTMLPHFVLTRTVYHVLLLLFVSVLQACDVLVDDVFYYAESQYSPSILAQAIEFVKEDGAVYFTSVSRGGRRPERWVHQVRLACVIGMCALLRLRWCK